MKKTFFSHTDFFIAFKMYALIKILKFQIHNLFWRAVKPYSVHP